MADEQDLLEGDLSYALIGAAIEVHKVLGPGFGEATYERALARELELRGIGFRRQASCEVSYKGAVVGTGRIDFLVDDRIAVELKSVEAVSTIHERQLLAYLRMTGIRVGLLFVVCRAVWGSRLTTGGTAGARELEAEQHNLYRPLRFARS